VTRVLGFVAAMLMLSTLAGCGDMSDESYKTLEEQRADVLLWGRELSRTAASVLESSPENARESYDGVDKSGLTNKFVSFRVQLQASFNTTHADPLPALAQEMSEYSPTVEGNVLKLVDGEFNAVFRVPIRAKDRVAFEVVGPSVEIKQDDLSNRGWIIGESVDLD
jgi:hypothetical protein